MPHRTYRYQLVRYVPDLDRMEPLNVGVIVQWDEGVGCRFNTHFRPEKRLKSHFDHDNYRAWREYLDGELRGATPNGFAPSKTSPDFLVYLMSRCQGNYRLTEPLCYVGPEESVAQVLDVLYGALVSRHGSDETRELSRPVECFRSSIEELRLPSRFARILHHNEFVQLGETTVPFYYWYQNEIPHLIDKVEIGHQPRLTQLELDALLPRLREVRATGMSCEIVALIDPEERLAAAKTRHDHLFRDAYLRKTEEIRALAHRSIKTAVAAREFVLQLGADLAAEAAEQGSVT